MGFFDRFRKKESRTVSIQINHQKLHKLGIYLDSDEDKEQFKAAMTGYITGTSLIDKGKYQEAIRAFDLVLMLYPRCYYALSEKGFAFRKLGNLPKSIECYNKALEIDPNFHRAWLNKGTALKLLGKPQEAIKCYEKFMYLAPHKYASDVDFAKKMINQLS